MSEQSELMLSKLAALGIRLRPDASVEDLYLEDGEFLERAGYEALLIAMGSDQMLLSEEDATELRPFSDDVLYFDHECIEGPQSYASLVDDLCRLTADDLRFDEWTDYSQYNLRFDTDWIDEAIFRILQNHLVNTGSRRPFAIYSPSQHSLMICQPPEVNAAINKLTGLGFREVEVAN
jgi:hypothetical protein